MNETIKLISAVVVYYPKQLAKMLNDNAVVIDATNFTTKELSDATVVGLTTSKKFNEDFVSFVKSIDSKSNFSGADGYSNAIGDWTSTISAGIPALTNLFMSNTNTKNLQAQLDAQNQSNATQLQIAQLQLQTAQAAAQGGYNQASAKTSGNTTLYVALGIGGALVLGIVIFLVTRKK